VNLRVEPRVIESICNPERTMMTKKKKVSRCVQRTNAGMPCDTGGPCAIQR